MPVLPGSLALTVINDGAPIIASDHRNNYSAIQGGVNGLIGILDNGNAIDGDPLVWDATLSKWSAASRLAAGRPRPPRIVTSLMSGGPPAAPLDQDIWIATAVDANGTRWAFQYNAGSASPYKWEFVGGAPIFITIAAFTTNFASAYTEIIASRFTAARGGDYEYAMTLTAVGGSALQSFSLATFINGVLGAGMGTIQVQSVSQGVTLSGPPLLLGGMGAGSLIGGGYWANGTAGLTATNGSIQITPRRVS